MIGRAVRRKWRPWFNISTLSTIGLAGLGNMGKGMGDRLVKKFGENILCYDIVASNNIEGSKRVSSLSELAHADIVITMLPATKHVESALRCFIISVPSNYS